MVFLRLKEVKTSLKTDENRINHDKSKGNRLNLKEKGMANAGQDLLWWGPELVGEGQRSSLSRALGALATAREVHDAGRSHEMFKPRSCRGADPGPRGPGRPHAADLPAPGAPLGLTAGRHTAAAPRERQQAAGAGGLPAAGGAAGAQPHGFGGAGALGRHQGVAGEQPHGGREAVQELHGAHGEHARGAGGQVPRPCGSADTWPEVIILCIGMLYATV